MPGHVDIRAGAKALEIIRDGGFGPGNVFALAGASGGPKWLVLAGFDRLLPAFFAGRAAPLHLVGSSIGAWRSAALASPDPLAALARFAESYIGQRYAAKPTAGEVTAESKKILDAMLGPGGGAAALSHPFMRLTVLAVRSKGIGASEGRVPLTASMAAAAAGNLLSRRLLGLFVERTVFHDRRDLPPLGAMTDFPPRTVPLTANNFKDAIMASGSIPLVMDGVTGIAGAPPGTYRDGGIIDYHLDLPFEGPEDGVVLYPHFYNRIIPGWFDKGLPWRRPRAAHMDRVVLVSPSREFVRSLPGGRVPDREDFRRYRGDDAGRMAAWRRIATMSSAPAGEFFEAVESGKIRAMARPLERND